MQTPDLDEVTARLRGAQAGAVASLEVSLGNLVQRLDRQARRREDLWRHLHPVPILVPNVAISAGAGVLNLPDPLGPNDGFWWDVRRLTVWGFSAGTVTAFLNQNGGEQLGVATQAGQFTWSGQILLAPRDAIVLVAAGITGSVSVGGQAIEVESSWLPEYLL